MPAAKPSKPPATPPAAPTQKPVLRPFASALTPKDIDHAQKDALLQLSIGRGAHYYSVGIAAALLLDTALVLVFPPAFSGASSRDLSSLYFLLLPLVGGLYLALWGLWVKWEEYLLWPWEPHFAVTVAAVIVDALLLGIWGASVGHYGGIGSWNLLPAFYPLALLAVSLPMVGLGLTWPDWTQSKTLSVCSSIAPVLIGLVVFVPGLSTTAHASSIALSLSVGAIFYLMAGSFLHLIASGTRPHERAVILSSQSRLVQVARQLKNREEAVRFREASLIGREADVENAEIGIQRKLEAIEEARAHATTLETEGQARSSTLTRLQRELAVKLAETNAKTRGLEDREQALLLREKDLEARLPRVSGREKEVIRREGEVAQREAGSTLKAKELDRRSAESTELDARLTARRQEIDRKTQELLSKEGELARKAPSLATGSAPGPRTAAPDPVLTALKVSLDQQRASLEGRAAEVQSQQADLARVREALAKEREDLRFQEEQAAEREQEAAERLSAAEANARRYDEGRATLEEKLLAVDGRAAILLQRTDELDRREKELVSKAKLQNDREATLSARQTELDRRRRDLTFQEKTVASLDADLRLARQSVAKKAGKSPEFSLAFAAVPESGYMAPPAAPPPRRQVAPVDSPYVPRPGRRPSPCSPDRSRRASRTGSLPAPPVSTTSCWAGSRRRAM